MVNMSVEHYLSELQYRTTDLAFKKAQEEFEKILLNHCKSIDDQIENVKVNWVGTTYSELADMWFNDSHSSVDLIYRDGETVNINTNLNSFIATYTQIEKYLKEK